MANQNVKEQLTTLEKVCQTKEELLQAKEAETRHLKKLVELKQKMITEMQMLKNVKLGDVQSI